MIRPEFEVVNVVDIITTSGEVVTTSKRTFTTRENSGEWEF